MTATEFSTPARAILPIPQRNQLRMIDLQCAVLQSALRTTTETALSQLPDGLRRSSFAVVLPEHQRAADSIVFAQPTAGTVAQSLNCPQTYVHHLLLRRIRLHWCPECQATKLKS